MLCVHGVGHGDVDPQFQSNWGSAITDGVQRWNPTRQVQCKFVRYDDLFAKAPLNVGTVAEAIAKLSYSGIVHGIGGWLGLSRDFGGLPETLRWTAGMIAQWAVNKTLRAAARRRLLSAVTEFNPDLIVAHSLGSLIGYDTFARKDNAGVISNRRFVTLGSQIGNPFVRDALGGRIVMLPASSWSHLYNPHDKAFAAPIRLTSPQFEQVSTPFDVDFLDHDARPYLTHPNTSNSVWRVVAGGPASRALTRSALAVGEALRKPKKRGLLIGINNYPEPANRLEGCVNDVFQMSAVLQEWGFAAEDIRVVLNDRATAAGILERLEWLLEGAEDGQDRVLFYSGHGAQIPEYGTREEVDHLDEGLVPYDFDWTPAKAISDNQFHELYSQLPYQANFLAVFDCCHAGGMTRDGGPRVRGLTPPDDIRHRLLRWNAREQMWEQRSLEPDNPDARKWKNKGLDFVGKSGATRRLGRGMALRSLPNVEFDQARKDFGHQGPYMPVILEACQEDELSYEYRHGVTSYGAFTYILTQVFRESRRRGAHLTWEQLKRATQEKLRKVQYDQTPVLAGPQRVLNKTIPWNR